MIGGEDYYQKKNSRGYLGMSNSLRPERLVGYILEKCIRYEKYYKIRPNHILIHPSMENILKIHEYYNMSKGTFAHVGISYSQDVPKDEIWIGRFEEYTL